MDDLLLSESRQFDPEAPLAALGTIDRRPSPFSIGADGRSVVPSFRMSADRPRCGLTPKEYQATEEPPSLFDASAADETPFALVPLGLVKIFLDVLLDADAPRHGTMPDDMDQEAILWNSERTIR
jgi:hypothetical protein